MEENTIDLKKYWLLLKHWAWLLILALVVGAAAGYGFSRVQAPIYQAANRILIVRAPQTKTTDITYLSDQQLTITYVQLLTTQPVLDTTSQRLGYKVDPDQVNSQIILNTQIIKVMVEDRDPKKAADIANALVEVIIDQNEKIQAGRYTSMEESIQAQIDQIEGTIAATQTQLDDLSARRITDIADKIASFKAEITQLQKDIPALTAAAIPDPKLIKEKQDRLALLQSMLASYEAMYTNLQSGKTTGTDDLQLSQLRTSLNSYQQLYASLVNNLASTQLSRLQNTPNVVMIEPATVPIDPIRPKPLLNTALGGILALLLTIGILFLSETLDNTVKTSDEIEQLLGLSAIGYIAEMKNKGVDETGTYVSKQPRSQISEAFRSLRTNIEFASVAKPIKTILVTSPEPDTGKTTIAANLAAIFAQKGRRVLLLDADLRRPQVHHVLQMKNRIGLTDLLLENQITEKVNHPVEGADHLSVITSGSLPPNPAELLGSAKMERILAEIGKTMDIVVIDSPPSMLADVQVLAAKVDAVILVVRPGKTQKAAVKATIELLTRANARIIGVVLNKISRDRGEYYSHYSYQNYGYLASDGKSAKVNNGQSEKSTKGNNGESEPKETEKGSPFFRQGK